MTYRTRLITLALAVAPFASGCAAADSGDEIADDSAAVTTATNPEYDAVVGR